MVALAPLHEPFRVTVLLVSVVGSRVAIRLGVPEVWDISPMLSVTSAGVKPQRGVTNPLMPDVPFTVTDWADALPAMQRPRAVAATARAYLVMTATPLFLTQL